MEVATNGAAAPGAGEAFAPVDLDAPETTESSLAVATQESPEGADTAPPEPETSGETKEAEPAVEPTIQPPRSWSKEAIEHWSKLDPATQEYLVNRDREDSAAVKRSLQEAADKTKAVSAKEQAAEQARQQYEGTLPHVLHGMLQQQVGEFGDLVTPQGQWDQAKIDQLAKEDWPRYILWNRAQEKTRYVQGQIAEAQQRQEQERTQQFTRFADEQDKFFLDKNPDMADSEKASAIQDAAIKTLKSLGYDEDELVKSWNGQKDISLRDHRMQQLVRKATQWDEAQAKAKAAVPRAQPKPQSAGTGQVASDGGTLAGAADKGDMKAFIAMRTKGAER